MPVSDKFQCEPFAVRRPWIVKATAGTEPGGTVSDLTYLFGFQIKHHQPVTVFYKGKFLPVRWELRIGTFCLVRRQEYFFFNGSRIGEVGFFLTCNLGHVKFPVSVAFTGVRQNTVVRWESKSCFTGRGMCDLLGGIIIGGSDEYFTSYNESNLFAVRWYGSWGCSVTEIQIRYCILVITDDIDFDFLRFISLFLSVYFSIIRITESAVAAHWQEADRMGLEMGDRFQWLRTTYRKGIYVECTSVSFAQEINGLPVGRKYRVTVFACMGGQVGMLAVFRII